MAEINAEFALDLMAQMMSLRYSHCSPFPGKSFMPRTPLHSRFPFWVAKWLQQF